MKVLFSRSEVINGIGKILGYLTLFTLVFGCTVLLGAMTSSCITKQPSIILQDTPTKVEFQISLQKQIRKEVLHQVNLQANAAEMEIDKVSYFSLYLSNDLKYGYVNITATLKRVGETKPFTKWEDLIYIFKDDEGHWQISQVKDPVMTFTPLEVPIAKSKTIRI